MVRKGLKGKDRVLIDPNAWAKDGATALDSWVASKNGKLLAYTIQDGGSDWRTIRVLDVKTGKPLADEIQWAKFTSIAWIGNEGFLYSRFAEPKDGAAFQQLNFNQTVYFHKIGTPQSADQVVYATPDRPNLGHQAEVTQDGRWVVLTSSAGTDEKYELNLIDIKSTKNNVTKPMDQWRVEELVQGLNYDWQLIEGLGNKLYFVTNKNAPKLKVVSFEMTGFRGKSCKNIRAGEIEVICQNRVAYVPPQFTDVIPEREETLARAQIVGDRLVLSYLKDAASMALMTDLSGKPVRQISLNAIGTASGFSGTPGDPETFYNFASFNQPGAVYRFDSRTGKSTPFATPKLSFNPDDIAVSQIFYPSKDGTKIPMFLVHRKDVDLSKGAPTILYGYGGFNLAQLPSFDPRKMAWIQSGGVFALANLRGGGEYGKPWHDAGRLLNKQNVFDDFIAAGEYLVANGITTKEKLAVEGRGQRRITSRRGGQPTARFICGWPCGGRGHGHAAFRPLYGGSVLGG